MLHGKWHLAVHDSVAELLLVDAGALLVATLIFRLPALPTQVEALPAAAFLQFAAHAVS